MKLTAVFRVVLHKADRQVFGVVAFVLVCPGIPNGHLQLVQPSLEGISLTHHFFEKDLGDHTYLRVRFKPRLEALLVGLGIIEYASQASLLVLHSGLNVAKSVCLRQHVSAVRPLHELNEFALL